MASDFGDFVGRELDKLGPTYQECHVQLIDALRDYIRVNERIRHDLLSDGVTPEQLRQGDEHQARCRALLAEIEEFEFDPSLCGAIRAKR
jgi:hypothetical protein